MLEPLFTFPNYINIIKYFPTKYYQPPWNTTSDSSNSTGKTTLGRTWKSWSFCLQQSCWHRFLLTQPGSSAKLWRGSHGHGLAQEVAPHSAPACSNFSPAFLDKPTPGSPFIICIIPASLIAALEHQCPSEFSFLNYGHVEHDQGCAKQDD